MTSSVRLPTKIEPLDVTEGCKELHSLLEKIIMTEGFDIRPIASAILCCIRMGINKHEVSKLIKTLQNIAPLFAKED